MSGQAFSQASRLGIPAELLEPLMRWRAGHPLVVGDRVCWSQRAAELAASRGEPPSAAQGMVTAIVEGRNGLQVSYLVAFDEPVPVVGWARAMGEPCGRRFAIDLEMLQLVTTGEHSEPCYPAAMISTEQLCDELDKLGVPASLIAPIRSWRARPRLQVGDRVRWSKACIERQAVGVTAFEHGLVEEILDPKQGELFVSYRVNWHTSTGQRFQSYQPAELLELIERDKGTKIELQSA